MPRALRFVAALVIGLALVTWLASTVVTRTTRGWFDKDIRLRASLAVQSARSALQARWAVGDPQLRAVLTDLTHDERIMGAAACAADGTPLAQTPEYPSTFGCAIAGGARSIPGGRVHVNTVPLFDGDPASGYVVLVHDLSFVERREARTQQLLIFGFVFLAIAASVVTLVASRLSWRSWSKEVRRLLRRGEEPRPEFKPILRDVEELVERLVAEHENDRERGAWTSERLRQTLARDLHGQRVVIVANREPYIHLRTDDGGVRVLHPASGLVTALEPIMRACSGVWVAHGAGTADRETVDRHDRVKVPPGEESFQIRRVWMSAEEERGYYYGFSNEGLWPLCHIADARPTFRTEDWTHYRSINERFAEAVCQEVDSADPIILVQDYHFALAPMMIRKRLPRATVIMFWHIPWPNAERFGICPWRNDLIRGMLGSSIVGFHTQLHCNNFLDSVDRFLEARIDREENAVIENGRRTLVRPYPISIEWPNRWSASAAAPLECRAEVFAELGLAPDALLGVGVDRLDYTKGVEERLLAVERTLERFPALCGRFTFVQLAAPSRTEIERYRLLNEQIEAVAARINTRFGTDTYRPVILRRAHHEPPTVFKYFRASDLCYVSSLHDGMNLVAKEYCAARDDERGVLVLSQFTGAARELTEALVVNPYDLDQASSAIAAALQMSPEEQRDRMRPMRRYLAEHNVYRWAGRMLVDAARLRSRDKLTGRLREHLGEGAVE